MKPKRQLLIVTVGLLFLLVTTVQAQPFKIKNFSMHVSGTSTMHAWQSSVENFSATGSFVVASNDLVEVKDVVVKIPVTSIKSTKGKVMDNKTYEAFNHEKHPQIVFVMKSQTVNASNSTIDLKGTLSMAGKTLPVDLKVNYKLSSGGELRITGAKQITMTDFGMEPPTAMMGAIKVGNDISVTFEITLTNNNAIL
jgi:polyisoprenoid-binding protein YceI